MMVDIPIEPLTSAKMTRREMVTASAKLIGAGASLIGAGASVYSTLNPGTHNSPDVVAISVEVRDRLPLTDQMIVGVGGISSEEAFGVGTVIVEPPLG